MIDRRTLAMRRVVWRMIIPLVVWDATPQGRRRGRSPIALSKVVQDQTGLYRAGTELPETYAAGLFCIWHLERVIRERGNNRG